MSDEFRLERHPIVLLRPRLVPPYGWAGHIPFAFLLVDLLRPRRLVELGTHSGNSYMAFCQAVNHLELKTRCTAVDSWEGDAHAKRYGAHIYDELRALHDPLYDSFSELWRTYFDEAADRCEDGSIDLLHIDGLHTYEAVKHDFEVWLPKLSDRGVVLFHDTAEDRPGFGVSRLFRELRQRYPGFEFTHSSGLGVILTGDQTPSPMLAWLKEATDDPQATRGYFEALAGTLVETDGLPAETIGAVASEVICSLYYREASQHFDDRRMLSLPIADAAGPMDVRFHLPADARADFLRIDPASFPGVFEIVGVGLAAEGGEPEALHWLSARLGHVNGDLLPASTSQAVRFAGFDDDPWLEFEVNDAQVLQTPATVVVTLRINYLAVVRDVAARRALDEQIVAMKELRRLAEQQMDTRSLVRLGASQAKVLARIETRMDELSQSKLLASLDTRMDELLLNTHQARMTLDSLMQAKPAWWRRILRRLRER